MTIPFLRMLFAVDRLSVVNIACADFWSSLQLPGACIHLAKTIELLSRLLSDSMLHRRSASWSLSEVGTNSITVWKVLFLRFAWLPMPAVKALARLSVLSQVAVSSLAASKTTPLLLNTLALTIFASLGLLATESGSRFAMRSMARLALATKSLGVSTLVSPCVPSIPSISICFLIIPSFATTALCARLSSDSSGLAVLSMLAYVG